MTDLESAFLDTQTSQVGNVWYAVSVRYTGGESALQVVQVSSSKQTLHNQREWEKRKRRAIFLSFDSEDMAYVNAFRSLAKNEYIGLTVRACSLRRAVPSRRDEVIEDEAPEAGIHRTCSVCVCLIGLNTWQREWVNWEVSTCAEQGRGILGIRFSNAGKGPSSPRPGVGRAAEILDWVPHEFEDAIERSARAAGHRLRQPPP